MTHTDIYDRLPYVKRSFGEQFEPGQRFACLLGGVIPYPAELIEIKGEKAMRIHLPIEAAPTQLQVLSAQFDDDETFAALLFSQHRQL